MFAKLFKALCFLAGLTLWATSGPVHAMTMDSGDNKKIYLEVESGKQIDAIAAFKEALADKKVLECVPVEAVGNQRTGKVTLKHVK